MGEQKHGSVERIKRIPSAESDYDSVEDDLRGLVADVPNQSASITPNTTSGSSSAEYGRSAGAATSGVIVDPSFSLLLEAGTADGSSHGQ